MIRMGRSSKPEPTKPETPNNDYAKNTNSFNGYQPQMSETASFRPVYESSAPTAQNRAMTDSETMARDIKEGRLSGFVGSGTMLTGETSFKAMLRIDGHLTGRVTSDTGTLIIGTNGQVDANIMVGAAVIHGTVNGDIVATERIEMGRTAKVVGNVQTPSLNIEMGAIFEGNCSMIRQKAEMEKSAASAQTENYSNNYESVEQQIAVESEEESISERAVV